MSKKKKLKKLLKKGNGMSKKERLWFVENAPSGTSFESTKKGVVITMGTGGPSSIRGRDFCCPGDPGEEAFVRAAWPGFPTKWDK